MCNFEEKENSSKQMWNNDTDPKQLQRDTKQLQTDTKQLQEMSKNRSSKKGDYMSVPRGPLIHNPLLDGQRYFNSVWTQGDNDNHMIQIIQKAI